jgi:electron transport complex protein RnfE
MGFGMLWTLGLLGALREFLGNGTVLGGIDMVIPSLQPIQLLPESYPGFLLALLPPGAFILLGCMIAWKNWMESRLAQREKKASPQPVTTAGCH